MIVGIGFIGILTGTIATYFIKEEKYNNLQNEDQMLNLSDLDREKFEMIREYREYLKSK